MGIALSLLNELYRHGIALSKSVGNINSDATGFDITNKKTLKFYFFFLNYQKELV